MVGRQMYLEEDESKQIYVMDSCSASCGETQLALLGSFPGGTGTSLSANGSGYGILSQTASAESEPF